MRALYHQLGRVMYAGLVAVAPFLIVGGLLYAGLFIKPQAKEVIKPPPTLAPRDAFYGVSAPAPGVFWAVGRGGKIVRSDDGGRHWRIQKTRSAEGVALQAIAAWDVKRAVVVGDDGVMLRTVDGGARWSRVAFDDDKHKLLNARAAPNGVAWAVGEFDTVLVTEDYGVTWRNIGGRKDIAWNDIAQPRPSHLVLVGEFGHIRLSDDGGEHWSEAESPVKSSLLGVAFRDPSDGVAVGLDGELVTTDNGGVRWQRQVSGTTEHLFAIAATPTGWVAVGDHGVLLRAAPDARRWRVGRIAPHDYAWLTSVAPTDASLLLGGQTLALLNLNTSRLEIFK